MYSFLVMCVNLHSRLETVIPVLKIKILHFTKFQIRYTNFTYLNNFGKPINLKFAQVQIYCQHHSCFKLTTTLCLYRCLYRRPSVANIFCFFFLSYSLTFCLNLPFPRFSNLISFSSADNIREPINFSDTIN